MDGLTVLAGFAIALYCAWNFKRNVKKAADTANNASPEVKEIGLGLLRRFLGGK